MELTAAEFYPTVPERVLQDLKRLKVPVHLSGYRCLCVALPLFARDISQSMCCELYPAVAKELEYMDWRAVEFAIRRAIRAAWKQREPEVWEEFFPGICRPPANKKFIATLIQQAR